MKQPVIMRKIVRTYPSPHPGAVVGVMEICGHELTFSAPRFIRPRVNCIQCCVDKMRADGKAV